MKTETDKLLKVNANHLNSNVLARAEQFSEACKQTFLELLGAVPGEKTSFVGARQKLTSSNLIPKLMENLINNILWAESEIHIEETKYDTDIPNRHNGKMPKIVKSSIGDLQIKTPRDRAGTFTPEFIEKRETFLSDAQADRIISMYSYGLSQDDISKMLSESYGITISQSKISKIIDRIIPEIKSWQNRKLDNFYDVIYLDALYYHVIPDENTDKKAKDANLRAVYNVLGINREGHLDLLGLYIGKSEGAKMWTGVLSDLKERCVEDVGIFVTDGLTGFKTAIKAVYPQALHQRCIVHQVRDSISMVKKKDRSEVSKDLKGIYNSETIELAKSKFETVKTKWGEKYPDVIKSWKRNWNELTTYYKFEPQVKTLIYTTNPIEGYHRQLRKFCKSKAILPNDESVIKLIYLIYRRIEKNWEKKTVNNWDAIQPDFEVKFGERRLPTEN